MDNARNYTKRRDEKIIQNFSRKPEFERPVEINRHRLEGDITTHLE
jgi:hypothetical protein